jgi:uncharacterized protein (UPF0333 family)
MKSYSFITLILLFIFQTSGQDTFNFLIVLIGVILMAIILAYILTTSREE